MARRQRREGVEAGMRTPGMTATTGIRLQSLVLTVVGAVVELHWPLATPA